MIVAPKTPTDQKKHFNNIDKMKNRLQVPGIKQVVALSLLVTSTLTVSAQKSVVLDAFSKYGIDASLLEPTTLQQPTDYAYDLKATSTAAGKQTVTMAQYDPSKPAEERWTVVSVNGQSPSRGEVNSFRKEHAKPASSSRADDASYKIDKETADYLLISYKQDPTSLPKDASFMKDCRMYMTINLKTKKAEQSQVLNEKPVKIKMLTAEKFEIMVKYNWNSEAKRYFTVSEALDMQAKFLGQTANVETASAYSNFAKK
ncbi:hypothetical protein KTO58_11595 [Chitinophaga pendula]|uniref:hypothetical protein n=1 Tax=Chitinophaga TaxID=79328 RepID=UPI000BB002F2|nr:MULTISPECIES: hypothetical protein [Chitinophaga]ASZ12586.1 hypothetical protein CK934_17300 [Chitinophaga sp. MD30]UCJ09811.1 hypothetical protein KTO58_11595 [Chitinophaga pendula]